MTWSSKQQLSPEDLTYLQDVLLEMSIKLSRLGYNIPGIMTNTTYGDMTQKISIRDMLESILTSLEKEQLV